MKNAKVRFCWVLPLFHLFLCITAFASFDRVMDCLLVVDFPLSALLFAAAWVFKFSNPVVLTVFAVFGTIWWHALGRLIDRRILKRKHMDIAVNSSDAAGVEDKTH
jgi:ABC-type dipeptide/oligopeptide/nickel transport system permease subunit